MISVIIPAYNAESTLERAVNSVLRNRDRDTNIEIIIIDDGSTDRTPSICDRYSQEDNIHVIHTENQGAASARNKGLRIAKGDYIGFVDSDDWVEEDMYRKLLDTMIVQQAELAACGVIHETEDGTWAEESDGIVRIIWGQEIYHEIIQAKGIRGYIWNKLFKRELITDRFDESIAQCEDLLFTASYCEKVSRAVYVPDAFYHYVRKKQNADYSYTKGDLSLIDAYEKLYALYQADALQYAYIPAQNLLKIYVHFRARAKIVKETDRKVLERISDGIRKYSALILKDTRVALRTKGNICLTFLFPKTSLRLKRNLLHRRHKLGIWES